MGWSMRDCWSGGATASGRRANEYVPTARGRDFAPVLVALLAWGNRHFAPEGASVMIVDATTGAPAEPVVVDRATGRPIQEPEFAFAPGPAAGEGVHRRLASRRSHVSESQEPTMPTKRAVARDARDERRSNR